MKKLIKYINIGFLLTLVLDIGLILLTDYYPSKPTLVFSGLLLILYLINDILDDVLSDLKERNG